MDSSTSVQMASWGPGYQTRVPTPVPSPSRLWTTCGIPARARLRWSASLRHSPSAPTGLSGVQSDPATTTTAFASRAPTSIIWTRLLDVLSRIAGIVVPRWTGPSLTDYKWISDCLHTFRPPHLLSCHHACRPSSARGSRLPSSTPTQSHNEREEPNAGTRERPVKSAFI